MMHHEHNPTSRRESGFSLMEVLLAMAIFAIGFTTIAAIFPVATLLQKQTQLDVLADQSEDTVISLMQARPFSVSDFNTTDIDSPYFPTDTLLSSPMQLEYYDSDPTVEAPDITILVNIPLWRHWRLNDRGLFTARNPNGTLRQIYWVPMIRRTVAGSSDPNDFEVFAFILSNEGFGSSGESKGIVYWANRGDPSNVPGVKRLSATVFGTNRFNNLANRVYTGGATATPEGQADQIRPGDPIIDSNGQIYTVIEANDNSVVVDRDISTVPASPTKIWYGRPPGPDRPSPALRIISVAGAMEP